MQQDFLETPQRALAAAAASAGVEGGKRVFLYLEMREGEMHITISPCIRRVNSRTSGNVSSSFLRSP